MGKKEFLIDLIKFRKVLNSSINVIGISLIYLMIFMTYFLSVLIFAKLYEGHPDITRPILKVAITFPKFLFIILIFLFAIWIVFALTAYFIKAIIKDDDFRKKRFKDLVSEIIKEQNSKSKK